MATTQNILIGAQTFDISAHLYAGSGSAANAATTNGNTKLTITNESTVRNNVSVVGTGATSVTSDANGKVTINSTDTTYSFADGENSFTVTPSGGSSQTVEVTPSLEKSATNSFDDGIDSYFKKVVSTIVPVQAGSGTPSPINERAISGFTECTVVDTGKNLYNKTTATDGYRIDGEGDPYTAGSYSISDWIIVEPSTQYTRNIPIVTVEPVALYDADKNFISKIATGDTFTTTPETKYIRTATLITNKDTCQIEQGSRATAYEPYNGTTATISFGSAGTVYGGTVNLTTGELVVDKAMVDLGSLNWNYTSSSQQFYVSYNTITNAPKIPPTNVKANAICSNYEVVARDNATNLTFCIATNGNFVIYDNNYTDATTFKNAMSGVQLVYELETPQIYQLTPAQLRSLVGVNRLTSSTGEVTEVEYITNETIAYVDDKVESITDKDSTFVFTLSNVPQSALTTYNTDLTQYSSATVDEIKAAVDAGKFIFCDVFPEGYNISYCLPLACRSADTTSSSSAVFLELITGGKVYRIKITFYTPKIVTTIWNTASHTVKIAPTSNTNQLTLVPNSKYALSVGSSIFTFTTPKGLTNSDLFTQASSASNMPVHSYYYDTDLGMLKISLANADVAGDKSRLWISMYTQNDSTVSFDASVSLVNQHTAGGLSPIVSSAWFAEQGSIFKNVYDNIVRVDFGLIFTLESYIKNTINSSNPLSSLRDYYNNKGGSFYIYFTK